MGQTLEDFSQGKIKGAIAEVCAREHFELMGYRCDSAGIENIANSYIALEKEQWGNPDWGDYSESIRKKYRSLPDFIISRKHPKRNSELDEHIDMWNQRNFDTPEVLFLEAKYRSNANLDGLKKEFTEKYEHFGNVIVYLVANGWKQDKLKSDELVVWLFSIKHQTWWKAGDDRFKRTLLYAGIHPDRNFNKVYFNVVKPVLDDLVKSKNK